MSFDNFIRLNTDNTVFTTTRQTAWTQRQNCNILLNEAWAALETASQHTSLQGTPSLQGNTDGDGLIFRKSITGPTALDQKLVDLFITNALRYNVRASVYMSGNFFTVTFRI